MTDIDPNIADDTIDLGAASVETKGHVAPNLDTEGGISMTGLSDD